MCAIPPFKTANRIENQAAEFGYFIDARNKCKYPQIPVEFQLAEGYEEWMKNHNAQFDGLDEFLKYLSSNK